ncbi:MAG: dihydrolipoyl dehydrogenase [Chloroflexi bacterium]|nr:dihydrolipoyl dehydrogenase [Chloroflexota bacterium]
MKKYDVIVVGSGSGMTIVEEAASHGLTVAPVDKGPLGGTCLNLGCIPSKMLICVADRIMEALESRKLGVQLKIENVDFAFVMERMRKHIREEASHIRQAVTAAKEFDFYEGEGYFVGDYTLEVKGERIRGDKIFLASGTRPFIPPLKGLDSVSYLTSESVLQLKEKPKSVIIIGGGYVGVEYGHFFAAMGTKVTIVEMADRIVLPEEPEISALLQKRLSERMDVHTGVQVEEVKRGEGNAVTVIAKEVATGRTREITAESLLVAVGRSSNADTLKVEKTGVATDKKGFIIVNEYLETNRKNIYAIGDATGQQMFTHAANREAYIAAHNVLHGTRLKMDFVNVPHAVYSYPQVASIGLTEAAARKEHDVLVGVSAYTDMARGEAMMEEGCFAKAVVDKESQRILGFHIIGANAPELIQEVTNAIASGGHVAEISQGIHIHPALAELVPRTLSNLAEA